MTKSSVSARLIGQRVALVLGTGTIVLGLLTALGSSTAAASFAPTYSVAPSSGPVGTAVHFSGNVGSSSVSSCGELNGTPTAFLQFSRGSVAKGNAASRTSGSTSPWHRTAPGGRPS